MKKFFDARREMVSSGPASGAAAGGGAGSGAFIGRVFSIGRYQVTVEETVAEGKRLYTSQQLIKYLCLTFFYGL